MGGVVFLTILKAIICLLLIQFTSSSSVYSSLNSNAESFIVGGRKASEGQFPYIVSLRTIWNTHMCGGGIINTRWILSAAHCTVFLQIPTIVAGSTQINGTGVVYDIENVINHENYDFEADPFIDDICLLRTNRSIQFTELIQPIQINSNRVFQRGSAVIAGWGWTQGGNHLNPENFNPVVSNDLNFIEVSVLSHVECTWRLSGWAVFLRLDHICTYGRNNIGVCTFDSGSPIVSNGQLVGVVSFAIPCALGFPDFGPRVSSYTRWINSHVRHL